MAKAPEVFSSPVGADGRVYVTSRDGITTVLKHGTTYEVLAENTLDDGFDASMALADNEIFLRGFNERRRYYRLTARGIAVAKAEVGRLEGQLAAARTRRLLKGTRG